MNTWEQSLGNDAPALASQVAVAARIYDRSVLNSFESDKEGRPIYQTKPFIEIMIPGDKNTIVDRPLKDEDKQAYPGAWKNYNEGKSDQHEGTLLKEWPQLNVDMVAQLHAHRVFTVEQLAQLSDHGVAKIGLGGQQLRDKAQRFLKLASQVADQQARDAKDKEQRDQIKALTDRVNQLEAEQAEKPKAAAKAKPKGKGSKSVATDDNPDRS